MTIEFDVKNIRPNFFLHAWHFYTTKANENISSWMKLVTEQKNNKFRVFDLVLCQNKIKIGERYKKYYSYFFSYGDGLDFEEAKDNAAIYFFEHHKNFEFKEVLNLLKENIPKKIDLNNAYETIMRLVKLNFMVHPTFHFYCSQSSTIENMCSMHIKSLGFYEIETWASNKEEVRNLAAYIYICKYLISDGEKYLKDIGYRIIKPSKYPYNEVARITGHFEKVGKYGLKFVDRGRGVKGAPTVLNIFTEENLKSNLSMEEIALNTCKKYDETTASVIDADWSEKHKEYFEPLDDLTEKMLEDKYPYIDMREILSEKDIKSNCKIFKMSREELQKFYNDLQEENRAIEREKIIKEKLKESVYSGKTI